MKEVLATVKKEEKQTTHTPYMHPNYNHRQGQNEHSQKSYVDKQTIRHPKQQLRQFVSQNNLRGPIKIDLGWTTADTMRQFSSGIRNSCRLISSSVAKDPKMTIQSNQTLMSMKL